MGRSRSRKGGRAGWQRVGVVKKATAEGTHACSKGAKTKIHLTSLSAVPPGWWP